MEAAAALSLTPSEPGVVTRPCQSLCRPWPPSLPRRCARLSVEPLAKLSPQALSRASIPMIGASETTTLPPRPGSASSLRTVRRCGHTGSTPPARQPTCAPFARAAIAGTFFCDLNLVGALFGRCRPCRRSGLLPGGIPSRRAFLQPVPCMCHGAVQA